MTYRSNDSSSKNYYSQPQSRLNHQIKPGPRDEGCPVLKESGSVCGETESLNVFLDFKKIYDDCLKNLKQTPQGQAVLTKLAPFERLIDHLWEQNAMLIETVEDLEEEATCRLSALQEKLNKSCQKIDDYQKDIKSLITIIHRFSEKGVLDPEGVEFKTFCPAYLYGSCQNSISECEEPDCKYNTELTSSLKSITCNNFESATSKLNCRDLRSASSKGSGSKVVKKSQISCCEKTNCSKLKSNRTGSGLEKNCLLSIQSKENKSVNWSREESPKRLSKDESDDFHSCENVP